MPGSVSNASPSDVLPQVLCTAFSESREFSVLQNIYQNGESQVSTAVTTSRKTYQLTRRLTASQLNTLRNFWENHRTQEFYVYNPWETSPKFSYDATGVATTGRHTVRFEGGWSESPDLARTEVSLQLVELA